MKKYHVFQRTPTGPLIFRTVLHTSRPAVPPPDCFQFPDTVDVFARPEYTDKEALEVVAWLNGWDMPLVGMVAPENDPGPRRSR